MKGKEQKGETCTKPGSKKDIIELENVWKIYKMDEVEVPALRGISLRVKKGEFLVILGPSGSGKSTLLHMIGCLDTPTKGKILLNGQNIACLEESELANIRGRKIGFVFQTFNLIPSLDAVENVALPMMFQGIGRQEREERAEELLEMVNLSQRAHHKPAEMSGGERQRVAIARALINNPDLILADEPTGNLDSRSGLEIMEILKKLHKEGRTIVMITHESHLAREADRICIIRDGQIAKSVLDGHIKEAYK